MRDENTPETQENPAAEEPEVSAAVPSGPEDVDGASESSEAEGKSEDVDGASESSEAEGKSEDGDDMKPAEESDEERYLREKEQVVKRIVNKIEKENAEDKKSKNRKWWIKTVLLLVMIGASIALMFGITKYLAGDDLASFSQMIRGINWGYFVLLLCVVLLYIVFESSKYLYLLRISTGKWRIRNSVKVMFLGKYYDGVTPLGTGGQPFQIYYLHKKDIPAGVATAVPLVKFTVNTFVLCLLAIIFFSIAPTYLNRDGNKVVNTTILVIAWISMIGNLLIPLAIVFVSCFPRLGKKFMIRLALFLKKLHIVKRPYRVIRKYVYEIDDYRRAIKSIMRHWWKFLPLILICIIGIVVSFSIPFFVVITIANTPPTFDLFLHIMCLSFLSYYASSLVPTPGNTGASETASSLVFATVAESIKPLIGWVILVWRFLTFYIYILSGIGINIFEIIRSAVRKRRAERARLTK